MSSITNPEVLIGIPTYNGGDRVRLQLENIAMRTVGDISFQVVVCDDSGLPTHREQIRRICKSVSMPVDFTYHQINRGVAAAWNTLTQYNPDVPYVVLINDDIFVAYDWLKYLHYALSNNPHAGSFGMHCYFSAPADIPAIMSSPQSRVLPRDPFSKEQAKTMPPDDGGNGPGRVMAPTGCFFGFSRKVYNDVREEHVRVYRSAGMDNFANKVGGGFDENYRFFYEESDFGTCHASLGSPSYCLSYPQHSYHLWSETFKTAPELNAGPQISVSRAHYTQKWGGHTEETHPRFMSQIPFQTVKWLGPAGTVRENLIESEHGYRER